MENQEFVARLKITFDNETMAQVGRRLKLPHATIRNYFQEGRLPAPEVLIKIANETGVSLTWLLTGAGDRYGAQSPPVSIGKFLDERIHEIIEEKLARSGAAPASVDADNYDVESAVLRLNDPEQILNEWFQHEGREHPREYDHVFFRGWGTFSPAEKTDAVRDAKRVLDRSMK